MAYGRSIELFLVDGTADGIVTAELSNWNGKAIKIPRAEVMTCKRDDLTQPGVYFLFCKEEGARESVYIGESENVKERLVQHIRDYNSGKETYEWYAAVAFIGRDLNKAHVRYLENRLYNIARSVNRYTILTKNTYLNTKLKESQLATMEEFIDDIKILLNALGYKVLENLRPEFIDSAEASSNDLRQSSDVSDALHLSQGEVEAQGVRTSEGFVVFKGSTVREKVSTNSISKGVLALRDLLFSDGTVENLTFTSDYLFSSPSAAASFLTGNSVNGQILWKNKDGITLKEMESVEEEIVCGI